MSDLFPKVRPPRKYKITPAPVPCDVVRARVLAYLSTHGPCCLHDFGRCDGLARVPIEDLADALGMLVSANLVRMWYDRVLIRNDEGKPSVARVPRFALAVHPDEEGGEA